MCIPCVSNAELHEVYQNYGRNNGIESVLMESKYYEV